jgi:hypothetical protein
MNYNGESPEAVIVDLETRIAAQALNDWFARDPYVKAVYEAMPPDDRNSVVERVRSDAAEAGYMKIDAEKWLSHHVNKMFDDGKLPEIEAAQKSLSAQAQAVEDYAIQTGPIQDVKRYLTATYRDPAQAGFRRQNAVRSTDDHIFPG